MAGTLLETSLIRRLERLEITPRRVLGGVVRGERRSRRKGMGTDFADYRQYTRGDDLRHIDWNIYGRLDRLFIKLFQEEQDLRCHLLLDASLSMNSGNPNKLDFARSLAAAIGYISLKSQDRLSLLPFDARTRKGFGPFRGRHHIRRLLEFLGSQEADGATDLAAACRELAQRSRGRSVVIIISDFLDPAGFESALRFLVRDTLDVTVMQVLSPQEVDPDLTGHLELVDVETEERLEVTVNARLRQLYRKNLELFTLSLQEWCTRRGMLYLMLRSDSSLEELILKRLRESHLIKG